MLNVIAGGIDTTQAQLSHALRLFAARPISGRRCAPPDLVGRAVEEVLRAEPITPFTARICLEPVEHRGVLFPAGTIVAVCAERGNREQPGGEDFDITATRDGRLLTFGAGPHFCLGANLARAELEEALAFLAPRMPGLAADGPGRAGWGRGHLRRRVAAAALVMSRRAGTRRPGCWRWQLCRQRPAHAGRRRN